jgi:3-isopropylmalate/(R)-2-methylmalate dehydratase small subunit
MLPFKDFTGIVAPLNRENVDTDQIIPKQFLKSISKTGFGENLFYDWRFEPNGNIKPDFLLNQDRYKTASILLAASNFGCGSSREHAVWALLDYGFRTVISSSFADIFYNNCFKNGVLPAIISESDLSTLFKDSQSIENYSLSVKLSDQLILSNNGVQIRFEVPEFLKKCLLEGLDDISLTLKHEHLISQYESKHSDISPSD